MKTSWKGVALLVAGFCVAGCPETTSDEDGGNSNKSAGGDATAASSTAAPGGASGGPVAPASNGKLPIVARAKTELDGKEPDAGYAGSTLTVSDTEAACLVPTGWKLDSISDVEKAISSDGKSRFAATGYGDGDDTTAKAKSVLAALELEDCTWSDAEDIRLGRDGLATKVSDGVCMRDKTPVRAIRAVVAAKGAQVVAIGGWDDRGGSDQDVFNSFRSLAKVKSVAACCSALTRNAVNAPPNQKLIYAGAIALCQTLVNTQEGRQALAQIRGKLPGVSIPNACR